MTKDERLLALLGRGYFPDELPPPFTTAAFAKYRKAIGTAWAAAQQHYPKTVPEIFSIPRAKGVRRDLSIVNPVAEYHVSKLIADNWVELRKHLKSCNFAPALLEITTDGVRAVPTPDFRLINLRQAEISASFDNVVIADISRFYGTLYTHAIPWALHTKPWSKLHLNTPGYDNSLGARLDVAVRKGNDNQTIGIPVGPDSSRIISEIVAAAVDVELRDRLKLPRSCVLRNVDDWYIGFDTAGQGEDAIAAMATACRTYQLEIHPGKTRSTHVGTVIDAVWPTMLRQTVFRSGTAQQGQDIEHFFALAFDYARDNPAQNVLDFAVKRTMSVKVRPENWQRYETYLLKASRSNPTTIPAVVQILASYNSMAYPLGSDRIAKLIRDLIRRCAPTGSHSEVAWALFLTKALKISLKANDIAPVAALESSACALIALDLRSLGLISGKLDTSLWQQSMNSAGLTSSNWLLAYEANLKGWLPVAAPNYLDAHPYFSLLKKHGVSFYDVKKNVKHIKARKPKEVSTALAEYLAAAKPNPFQIAAHLLDMSMAG
jgi:hypothetical protein